MRMLARPLTTLAFVLAIMALATTADAGNKGKGKGYAKGNRPRVDRPMPSVPEPTAALAFGAGLLAISAATRRRGRS